MPLAVEVVCEDPGPKGRSGVIESTNNQAKAFTRRLDGTNGPDQEKPLALVEAEHGVAAHLKGWWRFADWETEEIIFDELERALTSGPPLEWYELRGHACDHSIVTGVGSGGCPPDRVRRHKGQAPEGI